MGQELTGEQIVALVRDWNTLSTRAAGNLDWADVKTDILLCVRRMDRLRRRVFVLHYVMGHGPKAIGRMVGRDTGSVQWAIRNIMAAIVGTMSGDHPGQSEGPGITLRGSYPSGWAGGRIDWWDRS